MSRKSARRRRAEARIAQPYMTKIGEACARGAFPPGAVADVIIRHDDWCPKLRGGLCTCNPDLEVIYR